MEERVEIEAEIKTEIKTIMSAIVIAVVETVSVLVEATSGDHDCNSRDRDRYSGN